MPKEKVLKPVEVKNYFKELFSFFGFLMILITIGSLGKFGLFLHALFQVLLGDYAILYLLAFLIIMIKNIFHLKKFNFHEIKLQGILFIILAIQTLSHFTFYSFLNDSNNLFKDTLNIYKNYLKSYDESYFSGGGIVGAILFQILFLLTGKIGVIIISLFFIIYGLSILFNHDILCYLKKIKKVNLFINHVFDFFSKYFHSLLKEDKNYKKRITLDDFKSKNGINYKNIQNEMNLKNEEKIKNLISESNLKLSYEGYNLGYTSTTFIFHKLEREIQFDVLLKFFNYQGFFMESDSFLYLEIYNKFKELLTLKELMKENIDRNMFVFGKNNKDDYIGSNYDNLLICGSHFSGIKNILHVLIIELLMNKYVKIILLDDRCELKETINIFDLLVYKNKAVDINRLIEDAMNEYERRKEMLEYDDSIKLPDYFIFINSNLKVFHNQNLDNIDFLLKFGKKYQIYIIIVIRNEFDTLNNELNLIPKLIFKMDNIKICQKLIQSDCALKLQGRGDFLYFKENKISHGQTFFISMTDYLKILSKLS